jgi:hypothetical protein
VSTDWKSNFWPQEWRRSLFLPLPKKGDLRLCSNYRTIVLIPHASKILLRIIQGRLATYIEREISEKQAGFRKGRGMRDQIAHIRWILERALEYGKTIFMCCIDYSKAFDYVDHSLLEHIKKHGSARTPYSPHTEPVNESRSHSTTGIWQRRVV